LHTERFERMMNISTNRVFPMKHLAMHCCISYFLEEGGRKVSRLLRVGTSRQIDYESHQKWVFLRSTDGKKIVRNFITRK
jgi:hypothetical protein